MTTVCLCVGAGLFFFILGLILTLCLIKWVDSSDTPPVVIMTLITFGVAVGFWIAAVSIAYQLEL